MNDCADTDARPDAGDGPASPEAGEGPAAPVAAGPATEVLAPRDLPAPGGGPANPIQLAAPAAPAWMATPDQFESFRELRTRLLNVASDAGRERFTTIVVPLTDRCGGSFVARNLAAAFTLQERPSLLIECNFRGEPDDDGFGPGPDAEGLCQFLAEPDGPSAVLPIWPTIIRGLNVIPSGRRSGSFVSIAQREYFSSTPMKDLMGKVRSWPCHAFLDAPPIQGSPDARILSEFADYVVLVVGYGRASARDVEQAAAMFDRRKLAGAVFNEATAPGRRRRAG